ncbi:MAG: transporter substrate-binding domain-containing protein [Roseateles sp.]|nr:MAG: transporter substrate-binding domain-containing protein [Roseateles sp.]
MLAPLLLLALSLLPLAEARAQAMPRVDWVLTDAPPSVITEGPLQGQGYVQRMLTELLMPGLPGWQHEVQVGSSLRILRDLAERPTACTPYMTPTPARAKAFHLSRPMGYFLTPIGLVMRRDDPARPAAGAPLSLARYLASPTQPRLAVVAGRSYSPPLDKVLARSRAQVQALPLTRATRSVLAMIVNRHDVDATLVGDVEFNYFLRLHPAWQDQLSWMRLSEQPDRLQYGVVGCARSAEGQRVIQALNRLLEQPEAQAQVQQLLEHWQTPEGLERLRRARAAAPEFAPSQAR